MNALVRSLLCLLAATLLTSPTLAAQAITVGADKTFKLWDLEDGSLVKTVTAHEGGVRAVAVSADGKLIATGGADRKIKLWNPDGALVRSIDAHDGDVTCLSFSADGTRLASGGADNKVKQWKASDGSLVFTASYHQAPLLSVFAGPGFMLSTATDGKFVVGNEEGGEIFSTATGHTGGLKVNASNPASPVTYTGGGEGKIKYWSDGANGEFEGEHGSAITSMAVSSDGMRLLTGGADGKVKVWDTTTHKLVSTLEAGHQKGVTALLLVPGSDLVITGGGDGRGKAFRLGTGEAVKEVDAHEGGVTGIAFRP